MVLEQKAVNYSLIPAIAMAAYTTYKVILSAKSFVKTRRGQQLSVTMLRSVSFVDALVSVLSLQYTLIMTVDGAIVGDMFVLCAVSSFAFWIALVAISVFTLIGAVKKFRSHKTQ